MAHGDFETASHLMLPDWEDALYWVQSEVVAYGKKIVGENWYSTTSEHAITSTPTCELLVGVSANLVPLVIQECTMEQ